MARRVPHFLSGSEIGDKVDEVDVVIHVLINAGLMSEPLRNAYLKGVNIENTGPSSPECESRGTFLHTCELRGLESFSNQLRDGGTTRNRLI